MVLTVMKRIQTLKTFFIGAVLSVGVASFAITPPVLAQNTCGGADTAIIKCDQGADAGGDVKNSAIWTILMMAVNILTGLIAVAALFGIVYGSVLYTSAGGNQEQVKKAIGIFTNVGIGVLAYALMYIALNFLIPGGAF